MDYICIVQVLDRLAQAVEYFLNVHKVEVDGRPDNLLKIALHVLHYYVESSEVMLIFRLKYLNDLDYVGMVYLPQQSDLSQDPLAVHLVLKDVLHSLDGYLSATRLMSRTAYTAIASDSDNLFHLVAGTDRFCPIRKQRFCLGSRCCRLLGYLSLLHYCELLSIFNVCTMLSV